ICSKYYAHTKREQAFFAVFIVLSSYLQRTYTDSDCFADNPEHHRVASSTSGTRFAPTRSARIERVL
ncbi:hypothetical protein, partial [Deinococcus sp.]|uniref:hypothetical protein n=1 Tax=Deinococcus sp. TaxID=47478 RepID=UPI0025BF732B